MNRKNKMQLDGAGLWDYVKNVFSANDKYTNSANNMLKKYGDYNITGLIIEKSPIISMIDKAINFISLGKWESVKKKYNYDVLYHLYLIITLDLGNGQTKKLLLEKNQSINISEKIPSKTEKTQNINIFPPKNISLNNLLQNTLNKVGKDQYFIYDPFGGKNCQNWVKNIFESNNLYNSKINSFVFQPIQELSKDLGSTTTGFSKFVTDTAAFGERLLGLGEEKEESFLEEKEKSFLNILFKKNIDSDLYLKLVKYNASINGYNPNFIKFSNDLKHKLTYKSPNGLIYFGSARYNDFIIYILKEGWSLAIEKRSNYHKRFNKTIYDKYSPYELSKNILW